ncbi:serine hydrolase [Arthrobacter sp. MI7-26]|uniref:serine hydrolase domain-containing protein n=1 Tax=Arthrobacter sp. MI7-26 TaxID=2993653 RepID=UPI0022494A95|nr:serine hydrolase domain-containing protein [Arthrobacter sp. MI7-26]MCX2747840.1 serine hydrolase [Arthrobacter sp. MI7-26]
MKAARGSKARATSPIAGFLVASVVALTLATGACTYPPTSDSAPVAAPTGPSAIDVPGLEFFAQAMIGQGATAVVVEVNVRGNKWARGYGVRNVDTRQPAEVTDRIPAGGITKSMVSVSLLKLVEEGTVSLDDPVSKHLPEFNTLVHATDAVTVRSLLNHTSGLADPTGPMLKSQSLKQGINTRFSPEDILRLAGTVPWVERLAPQFTYSEANYAALALIIQRYRNHSISDVLAADIFEPLGLSRTTLAGPDRSEPTLIHSYSLLDGERLDVTEPELELGSAGAGVISSVGEVNSFYAALMRGRLLGPAALTEMKTINGANYGLGLQRWNDDCTNGFYYGHGGSTLGFGGISVSSADGTRQLSLGVAYPPDTGAEDDAMVAALSQPVSGRLRDLAITTLNGLC